MSEFLKRWYKIRAKKRRYFEDDPECIAMDAVKVPLTHEIANTSKTAQMEALKPCCQSKIETDIKNETGAIGIHDIVTLALLSSGYGYGKTHSYGNSWPYGNLQTKKSCQ